MATFCWHTRSILRSKGSSVTSLAAYRAGERIRSTYHGRVHDWSGREGVEHKEIVLPSDLAHRPVMGWANDRARLWSHVEHHETGERPPLARKWLMHLPSELNREGRRALALAYAHEVADQYRCAVDVCVHVPRVKSRGQHYHVHLMTTVREVTPEGFGALISLEVPALQRQRQGIAGSYQQECEALRTRWAQLTNASLQQAGAAAPVDPRRAQEQRTCEPMPPEPVPRGALTHEQLKARRREEYRAEREMLNNDPEALVVVRAQGRQRMRQWRAANPERDAQNRREWMQRNPERAKAKSKKYYDAHAAQIAERKKAKYHADLEESRAKVRSSYHRCALRRRLLKLETSAVHDQSAARAQGLVVMLAVLNEDERKHERTTQQQEPATAAASPASQEPDRLNEEEAADHRQSQGQMREAMQRAMQHGTAQETQKAHQETEEDLENEQEEAAAMDYDFGFGD